MRLWSLMIGLLLLILIAPFHNAVVASIAPLYSDTTAQIIVYLMLPALALLFIFIGLFFDNGGGYARGYR